MIIHKKNILMITLLQCLIFTLTTSCGTLGGLEERNFHVSKKKLEIAIDSLYHKYPEYKTPVEWEEFNDWSDRGYDFLESRIFYFKAAPQEMYYVTFIGDSTALADSTKCSIAVRSIFKKDSKKWLTENDFDAEEKQRIEKRFDNEIISKLELYTKQKSSKE